MTPPATETPPRSRRRGLPGAALVAWLACAGCNGDEPQRWQDLARGFEPRTALKDAVESFERAAGTATGTGIDSIGMGISLEHAIAPAEWMSGSADGEWAL